MKRKHVGSLMTAGMLAGCLAAAALTVGAEEKVDVSVFGAGEVTVEDASMQYRLYDPAENGYEAESYPLVLFLHGEDGVGTDNEAQLLANHGATVWVEMADTNPAYVLAPQAENEDWTTEENMELVMAAVNEVIEEHNVDKNRIYVQGMSMGGTGTWKMLFEHADLFAAGMPICGQVPEEYYETEGAFETLANMPIWVFHEANDEVIPAEEASRAVAALKDAGSNIIKYEEWSAGANVPDHEIWERVYEIGTPYNWLMMQSRMRLDPFLAFDKKVISDKITRICDYELGQAYVIEDNGEVLIIDSAMGGYGEADLYAYIRDEVLVDKDAEFDVLFTHNHGDHTYGLPSLYRSGKLKNVYINDADRQAVVDMMNGFDLDVTDKLFNIGDGDSLSVNGTPVEIMQVPGHSPGSIAIFYDEYLFTGDCIGSGDLWLIGAFGSYTVEDTLPEIQKLVDEIDARGIDFTILTGHAENKHTFHNEYAKDVLACAKGIVDGSIEPRPYTRRAGKYATYGSGNILYDFEEE